MNILDSSELDRNIEYFNLDYNPLVYSDSYNEREIVEKIKNMKKEDQIILFKCALSIAIVGAGNKSYGEIIIKKGEEPVLIEDMFNKYNIIFNQNENAKLKSDDITARRLVRVFRSRIQRFIKEKNIQSYLFRKYTPIEYRKNNEYFIFPSCEHLITNEDSIIALFMTYKNLDSVKNTNFTQKLKTVFLARNIKVPELPE